MSTDLKSQIHTYGAQLIDSQTPITDADIAELMGKVRQLPPTPVPAQLKPRLWVAAAAGIAVLVLFGGLTLLLSRTTSDTPPATTSPIVTSVTSPPTTSAAPEEETVSVPSGITYQSLPNEASIGWQWYETGLGAPTSELRSLVWRLSDGSHVAYSPGYNGDYGVSTKFATGQGGVEDPVETFHISTDGTSWSEVPLDRFEGLATMTHGESDGDLPYIYVSLRPLGTEEFDFEETETWATNDGETWFEVLIDGESAGTYWVASEQIGNNVVVVGLGGESGLLVSSDSGRSFATVNTDITSTNRNPLYSYDERFRYIAFERTQTEDGWVGGQSYVQNPILWESNDGETWTEKGVTTGLDPQPDGRALWQDGLIWVEVLPDGTILLIGSEPRLATFDDTPGALYILESHDGGLTWQQTADVPINAETDHDSLIAGPYGVTTLQNWVVISTPDVTLATNGTSWIRIDGRYNDSSAIDEYGYRPLPLALKGAVISGWGAERILIPTG